MLQNYWKENSNMEVFYYEKLLTMDASSNIIVLLSVILQYKLEMENDKTLLIKHKLQLLEHFVKGLITVKIKPNINYITSCEILLKSITANEFKTIVLPALQRAMLRSPEIILQGVGAIVNEIEIDISDYAFDIGKTLIQNLYSKDDSARLESVESIKQIAKKCQNATAIEALIKQIFAVLQGSDGKITITEYRINLLQVIIHYIIYYF